MAALRCYSSTAAIIVPRRKICARASMDGCSSSESRRRASSSVSFTCKVNKVYEDKNMGILCYTDETGELLCEGLDEGPRLTRQDIEKLTQESVSAVTCSDQRIEEHGRRLAGESAADRGRDRLERPPVCCCHGEEVKMEADFKLSPVGRKDWRALGADLAGQLLLFVSLC
ncbi:uncharacterized protein [Triticum aestivum]|uniref:uncharacterized protein isoform X1 n=1 Tax=Triticum aestivum TaxID=4565 RepID=UPI001D034A59|nr:uncharacterized protein LOC123102320 isoform X1 [Triticum aestivum]